MAKVYLNMIKSWQTTVGGILAAIGVGLRSAPLSTTWAWLPSTLEAIGVSLLGITAATTSHVAGLRNDVETLKANTTVIQKPK